MSTVHILLIQIELINGDYAPARTVWRKDDRIRAVYQALKKQIVRLPVDVPRIRKRYNVFEKEFKEMIFQEEAIILPNLQSLYSEDDWLAIANESDAFDYALKAGSVSVNCYNVTDPVSLFGGYKESGFGREMGSYALDNYTEVKSVWINLV